jgi:hypothetical protein
LRRACCFQRGFLEVELSEDPVHDFVGERAFAAQLEERVALCPEDELDHVLVGKRAVLIPFVLDLAGARGEAPLALPVEGAHSLDRVVAGPVFFGERVDLGERGCGRD